MIKMPREKCQICKENDRADPPIKVVCEDFLFEVCDECALLLKAITERLEQENGGEAGEDEPIQDY